MLYSNYYIFLYLVLMKNKKERHDNERNVEK